MSLLGKQAPDFTLTNTAGAELTLSDAYQQGPVVLIMFRAGWCSYCAEQLQTFSALSYDYWYYHDTTIIPVSGDAIEHLVEMRDRYDLRMQLFSDPGFSVTKEYTNIKEHDRYGEYTRSGTFVVDTAGRVRYEQLADSAADRTYANFVRYFIMRDYKDAYGTSTGESG